MVVVGPPPFEVDIVVTGGDLWTNPFQPIKGTSRSCLCATHMATWRRHIRS